MNDQIFKNLPLTISFSLNFENPPNISIKSPLFLFYNVYKEKMCTIEIEDGRNAP